MSPTCLLVCDHVLPEFSKRYGDYPAMFRRFLPDLTLDPYFVCDGQFPRIQDFNTFIATGSKFSVYDNEPWIRDLLALTRQVGQTDKKFVGICFGHQIIAQALGGTVEPAANGWCIGAHTFEIQAQRTWISPPSNDYVALMLCQDQVSQLPKRAVTLARSQNCPVGMFEIGNQFLAIQGHPEFTKEYDQAVYRSHEEVIDPETLEKADQSLQKPIDSTPIKQWILNFIEPSV